MTKLKPKDKISAGRMAGLRLMPYFGSGVFGMVPREEPGTPTFAVTKRGVMLWNPEYVATVEVARVAAEILHEVSHLVRKHFRRTEILSVPPEMLWLANLAQDWEINDDLRAAGLDLGPDWCFPEQHGFPAGLLWERYYELAREKIARCDKDAPKPPPGPKVGAGWCGSCAGLAVPGEPDETTEPGRTQAQLEATANACVNAVRKFVAQHGKGRGSVPSGLLQYAEAANKPVEIPWEVELGRFLRLSCGVRPGAVDYLSDRPSRRQAAYGFGEGVPVMPRMVRPVPNVVIVADTSGSMHGELGTILRHSRAILRAIGARVSFLANDCAVHALVKVERWEDFAKHLKGGGGTSFVPACEAIERMRPRPDAAVFITDGDGDWPSVQPRGTKSIVVLCGSWRVKKSDIPWGKVIELPKDKKERQVRT